MAWKYRVEADGHRSDVTRNDGWAFSRPRGDHRQYKHLKEAGQANGFRPPERRITRRDAKLDIEACKIGTMNEVRGGFEKAPNNRAAYVTEVPGCVTAGATLEEKAAVDRRDD